MQKAITVLKIITIVLNAFLLISSLVILGFTGSPDGHLALVIIGLLAPVFCMITLVFSKRLMSGFMWLLSSAATIFTNAVLLGFIIYALASWGMPPIVGKYFMVPFWLILPIISCITLFLVRRRVKKSGASACDTITSPNCSTEIPKE
jgi:hypothetical protein